MKLTVTRFKHAAFKPALMSLFAITCFTSSVKAQGSFDPSSAWQELENVITTQYAYLDRHNVDLHKLIAEYQARAKSVKTHAEFTDIGQQFLRHFYDPHLNMGPYNELDYSVFPTGSDINASYVDGHFVIQDIKANSAADAAGLRPGYKIISIDGLSAQQAIEKVFGQQLAQLTKEQINYGLNISLGGLRNATRNISVEYDGQMKSIALAATYDAINSLNNGPVISFENFEGIGYVRFNNALGNQKTVTMFQQALITLKDTDALIIDLRNTPSGGNTGVAEPILGHFVTSKKIYQLYQVQESGTPYINATRQQAYVTPSQPHYDKPYVVLAGHWTGSMGEGMTIGLDAIGATTVIGAPMADLLGGIKTVQLQESNNWLELGFERLYHANGTYREDFVPHQRVNPADRDINGNDPALGFAKQYLKRLLNAQ